MKLATWNIDSLGVRLPQVLAGQREVRIQAAVTLTFD